MQNEDNGKCHVFNFFNMQDNDNIEHAKGKCHVFTLISYGRLVDHYVS